MSSDASNIVPNNGSDGDSNKLYTLYFIRHAEALHNQLEKEAQSTALSLAISQGHGPDSPHAKQAQEDARKAILESDSVGDPPLSESGREEARKAKSTLERLIATHNLPHVEEVWVSPLQRTMQTAATIFPESSSPYDSTEKCSDISTSTSSSSTIRPPIIRVKKEIEERQTGYACDTHSSFTEVRRRMTFKQFSVSSLKMHDLALDGKSGKNALSRSAPEPFIVEEKPMLRERTKKLFNLLAKTECRSICVIAHKGYLRELERGPMGKVDAEMFQNCEVRVYRLHLDGMDSSAKVEDGVIEGIDDLKGEIVIKQAEKIAESRIKNQQLMDE
mmetsp:Transcript_24676/g.53476  ORF Transcript_24676/g.53476 Transcript_24676/m.53476 type:complete len:332 (-) Transcript_24676:301-1296(-)